MTFYACKAHVWAIFRIRSLTHLEVTFINFFFPSLFSGSWEFHHAICSIDGAKRTLELMNIEVTIGWKTVHHVAQKIESSLV